MCQFSAAPQIALEPSRKHFVAATGQQASPRQRPTVRSDEVRRREKRSSQSGLGENLAPNGLVQSQGLCHSPGVPRGRMNRLEISRLMERYIGSSAAGYLGTFSSHTDLLRFYVDCGVDVIPIHVPLSLSPSLQGVHAVFQYRHDFLTRLFVGGSVKRRFRHRFLLGHSLCLGELTGRNLGGGRPTHFS